jgi:hypothetical protein
MMAIFLPSPALALTPADYLGTAVSFGVLGNTPGITNTGITVLDGSAGSEIGIAPAASITNSGTLTTGVVHLNDATSISAQQDLSSGLSVLSALPTTKPDPGVELGGQILLPGVYSHGTFGITTTLTLDGGGDPNAIFVFQSASTLITADSIASKILLTNMAQSCNIYWTVGSSATLGTGSTFVGHVLAATSITAKTGASISGQLLARDGTVTLDSNHITNQSCVTPTTRSVTYASNSADLGSVPIDIASPYFDGNIVTALSNSGLLSKVGYLFSSWNTIANGSGTAVAVGATFSILADTTLFAQWSLVPPPPPPPLSDHTVTFLSNDPLNPFASTQTASSPTALTLNSFTRDGYRFTTWNSTSDGSGINVTDGIVFAFAANLTLYGRWIAVDPTPVVVPIPTPTPTPTFVPTPTPTPTAIPTISEIPLATEPPDFTPTPTPVPIPSIELVFEATPTPPESVRTPVVENSPAEKIVIVSQATPMPSASPTDVAVTTIKNVVAIIPIYDPLSEPKKTSNSIVAAFAALSVLAAGGAGMLGGNGARIATVAGGSAQQGFLAQLGRANLIGMGAKLGRGDQSRLWKSPLTAKLDGAFVASSSRVSGVSPLLSAVISNGNYLRAMIGSFALLLYPLAIATGFFASASIHQKALPPTIFFLLATMFLGIVDSLAGLIAFFAFLSSVALAGNISGLTEVLTLTGVSLICFSPVLLAGEFRPLRRQLTDHNSYWERATDYALATVLTGWVVEKMIEGLPGLSKLALPIASHGREIGMWAAGFVALRLIGEDIANQLFPSRITALEPTFKNRTLLQNSGTIVAKIVLFTLVSGQFIGFNWGLAVGAMMFALPLLLTHVSNRLPKKKFMSKWMPKGALEIVLMTTIGTTLALFLGKHLHQPKTFIILTFVLLGIPGLVISVLHLFVDEESETLTWRSRKYGDTLYRFASVFVLVGLVYTVFGGDIVGLVS